MATAASHHEDGGMTKLKNRLTEQKAPRRSRGFMWELLYLLMMAMAFNAIALVAVAVSSGQAVPVQAMVGVSVVAMLAAAFSVVVKGLRFFG